LQVIGKRDVTTCLYSGKPEPDEGQRDAEKFEQLTGAQSMQGNPLIARPGLILTKFPLLINFIHFLVTARQQLPGGTNYIAVVASVACILALMMPTEGDKQSTLPFYLHLSVHMKLVFAYVLGM